MAFLGEQENAAVEAAHQDAGPVALVIEGQARLEPLGQEHPILGIHRVTRLANEHGRRGPLGALLIALPLSSTLRHIPIQLPHLTPSNASRGFIQEWGKIHGAPSARGRIRATRSRG